MPYYCLLSAALFAARSLSSAAAHSRHRGRGFAALDRERSRLVRERAAHINRIKGLLFAQGIRGINVNPSTRPCEATERKRQLLLQLKSIGPAISALLSREVYYRQFVNRRQVGSFLGLTPSPYNSGAEERCQGISRAGNGQVRAIMIETAWLWTRHQPRSALTRWFVTRTAGQSTRMRKIMIVAVARKFQFAALLSASTAPAS